MTGVVDLTGTLDAAQGAAVGTGTKLTDFGGEPIWLILVKTVGVFVFLLLMTLFAVVAERRVVAWMQQRVGPNRVGPKGLLQSLADGIKLAFKEDIRPFLADYGVYFLAPVISATVAFMAWAVIPLGPEVSIFGERTPLQLTDFPVAVLFVLAMSSIAVYGIVLAGWSSGSTYSLLGALRSSAQMISYEVAMGLSLVGVFLYAGSMSTSEIVDAQASRWFVLALPVSFLVYGISVVGETNRPPFDLPEAESELVGGFHTEYSSLKFALFFLAEYINVATVCALATTLFFGGWRAPFPISLWDGANEGWWPLLWFTLKTITGMVMFFWLRATLPRFRYDQFMAFGWKVLVPVALGWLLLVSAAATLVPDYLSGLEFAGVVGVPLVLVLLGAHSLWERSRQRAAEAERAEREAEAAEPPPFPVPPLDLVVPRSPLALERAAGGDVSRPDREV